MMSLHANTFDGLKTDVLYFLNGKCHGFVKPLKLNFKVYTSITSVLCYFISDVLC